MIELKNVSAGYGGVDVVKNINFRVEKGKNLCILGPNGCGKTTLLKAMAGIIPAKGEILIDELNINQMKRYEIAAKVAVMTQISNVYFSYSIFETVMLGRYLHIKERFFKTPTKKDAEFVEQCLDSVGLLAIKDKQIDTLSGGQLQRVFFARTLAQEPEIILLDEPTNHLDLKYQKELIDYLKKWSQETGNSVVGVFHDINLAINLADEIIVLENGQMTGHGSPKVIMKEEVLDRAYGMNIAKYMMDSLKRWENIEAM